jgi:hypothetical protein
MLKIIKIPSRSFVTQFFVPKHEQVKPSDVEKLQNYLNNKPNILVLTGAGNENILNNF